MEFVHFPGIFDGMNAGDIYSIPIQGEHDNFPHLHVVIVELRGQCLVFPGFDASGHELRKTLDALEKQGLRST